MKKIIQKLLAKKARKLIKTHKPIVIGVTGSVGKTSARDAIANFLSVRYDVAPNFKNYNNEFGLPLTILGKKSPGRSLFGWIALLCSSPKMVPQVFVLEYGIDRPGDMDVLCEIVKPTIAVMTRISPVHAEYFPSVEALAAEKKKLLASVPENGLVVLNADDPSVLEAINHIKAPHLTYGFASSAQIRATDYSVWTREDFSFTPGEIFSKLSFTVEFADHGQLSIEAKNFLGKASVSSLLAGIAVAHYCGLTNEQILSKIPDAKLEPGRMNPIAGIKGSLILDSSYNAAPASMHAALDVLGEFHPVENARRIAVLGHMGELGKYSEQEHRLVGLKIAEMGIDLLVTVGEMAHRIAHAAIEAGIPEEHTQQFTNSSEAGRWLDTHVKKGDIILVKGSQSARMEKAVKDILAEPMRASELLVRQENYWLNQ